MTSNNEVDARELKVRALKLRILGGAFKQRSLDGTLLPLPCTEEEADACVLNKIARLIAEEAPPPTTGVAAGSNAQSASYILHLQSQLCLALSSLERSQSRNDSVLNDAQPPSPHSTIQQQQAEPPPVVSLDAFMSREITCLRSDVARAKVRMDGALSRSSSSSSGISLTDTCISTIPPDDENEHLDEDDDDDDDDASIASCHYDLVFVMEALTDKQSYRRSCSVNGTSLTDDGITDEEGEGEEELDSMMLSHHLELEMAREELGDSRSFSRGSMRSIMTDLSFPSDLSSSSAAAHLRNEEDEAHSRVGDASIDYRTANTEEAQQGMNSKVENGTCANGLLRLFQGTIFAPKHHHHRGGEEVTQQQRQQPSASSRQQEDGAQTNSDNTTRIPTPPPTGHFSRRRSFTGRTA